MANPHISFVVPAYNTENYLADCLDSILNQEGDWDFEVILVDDASTDGTEKVARSYTDPRIRYTRHESNRGAVVTINEGFERAEGELVARIDSDDRYRPYSYPEQFRSWKKNRKWAWSMGILRRSTKPEP